jgi:hypothetical protein
MGPYPLFACADWSALPRDLESLEGELVALSLVTDPFGAYAPAELDAWFDTVIPFKEHFVTDLSQPLTRFVERHHLRNARRAAGELLVERCADPARLLDDWAELYANLVRRHRIRGMAAFSRAAFDRQLRVPGIAAFRATRGMEVVGITLWYVQGDVAYYHLGAYSDLGYELRASFAIFWQALEHFAEGGLSWAALGGAAGNRWVSNDGLARFKRGWSTTTRTAYVCGRVLDSARYAALAASRGGRPADYFPAYRQGEPVTEAA